MLNFQNAGACYSNNSLILRKHVYENFFNFRMKQRVMRLLLSPVRRTRSTRWLCQSCRSISNVSASSKANSPSTTDLHRLKEPARTRFAPSPTGYLHLGSVRTALFNYLVAKATHGQFILRIEDTDQKRTIRDAEQRLFQDLEWAGIEWDEGPGVGGPYGSYKQSERTAIYREHAEKLLRSGDAYRCFCPPERLQELKEYRNRIGQPPDYDRKCAHIHKDESDDRASKGEAHIIRLKVPTKYPVYNDAIYGLVRPRTDFTISHKNSTLGSFEDPVLLKSDGFPTYHLANVVDDHLMKITHVIRGSEWLSSTPKHLCLYEAFGWQPPTFAHVSLLVDKNGQKLSKRNGSLEVAYMRDRMGIFPEALTNYISLLGWSHYEGNDLMGMEDLIRTASMKYTRGDTIVAYEKLWFLQKKHAVRYAKMAQDAAIADPPITLPPQKDITNLIVKPALNLLENRMANEKFSFYDSLPQETREPLIKALVIADAQNYTNPTEFINRNIYFFARPTKSKLSSTKFPLKLHKLPKEIYHQLDPQKVLKHFEAFESISADVWSVLQIKAVTLNIIDNGYMEILKRAVDEGGVAVDEKLAAVVKKSWLKFVYQYLRWVLAAGKSGPDGAFMMNVLGREETINRLSRAKLIIEAEGRENKDSGKVEVDVEVAEDLSVKEI